MTCVGDQVWYSGWLQNLALGCANPMCWPADGEEFAVLLPDTDLEGARHCTGAGGFGKASLGYPVSTGLTISAGWHDTGGARLQRPLTDGPQALGQGHAHLALWYLPPRSLVADLADIVLVAFKEQHLAHPRPHRCVRAAAWC